MLQARTCEPNFEKCCRVSTNNRPVLQCPVQPPPERASRTRQTRFDVLESHQPKVTGAEKHISNGFLDRQETNCFNRSDS
jgi:hypothetical protein